MFNESQIKNFLDSKQLSYKENKKSLILNCPECGGTSKVHIRKSNGQTKCMKCAVAWRVQSFLSFVLGVPSSDIESELTGGSHFGKTDVVSLQFNDAGRPSTISDSDFDSVEQLKEFTLDSGFVNVEQSEEGIEYLLKRGVDSVDAWIRWDIKFNGAMDGVVFPVKMHSKLIGWQCRRRNPKEGEIRMVSATDMEKTKVLMNYDNAKNSQAVALCEGPFDAIKIDMAGLPAVASLGKSVSAEQIRLLKDLPATTIYLALDADAYLEIRGLCESLCKHKNVFRLLPPSPRKDFGECSVDEVLTSIENAEQCFAEKQGRMEVFLKT